MVFNIVFHCTLRIITKAKFFVLAVFVHIGAGVVLILTGKVGRHVDIFDIKRFVESFEDSAGQLIPGGGLSPSDIKNPAPMVVQKIAGHFDGIFDIDEIAALATI